MSHDFTPALHVPVDTGRACEAARLREQWAAVHEAAAVVARMAQLGEVRGDVGVMALPERAERLGEERCAMIGLATRDLMAVLRPGLRALGTLADEGRDTTVAALALWREFYAARDAIVALAGPE